VVTEPAPAPEPLAAPSTILSGLIVSGFLLALPGGLLPLWGYHIRPEFDIAANYFLALGAGMIVGAALAVRLRDKFVVEHILSLGCFTGALALLLLSAGSPPAGVWFRVSALVITGAAAGAVNTAVLESIASAYEANPARVTLTAGIFFGAGSILAAWLMSECVESPAAPRLMAMAALIPIAEGVLLGRRPLRRPGIPALPMAEAMNDLRSGLAVLFALLLFFQFSSEWSIAGWLPVFLIDRLGLSPSTATMLLAMYWLALTAGRVVTARLLTLAPHGRLLAISAFCALFGCTALFASANRFGVYTGILLTGVGFSAIYPLAAEKIASRFSYYHPGYFNGIFTFALLGGILAPYVLGHLAATWGLQVIPLAALAGSCAVFALILLIWLGRKVSGS
jgi:fucose permease